ncbi:MAG: hypothetical protein IT542_08775 [Rubellimicrobium sp.]|nr:hypothetical protein [Rubellimicrobium sp.]
MAGPFIIIGSAIGLILACAGVIGLGLSPLTAVLLWVASGPAAAVLAVIATLLRGAPGPAEAAAQPGRGPLRA